MRHRPAAALLVWILGVAAIETAYVAAGVARSPESVQLSAVAMALAFVLWVDADARCRRSVPCHDFGFFLVLFYPGSLLWYPLWSRGWRGLLTLAGLFGLMLLPWASASVVWFLRYGW